MCVNIPLYLSVSCDFIPLLSVVMMCLFIVLHSYLIFNYQIGTTGSHELPKISVCKLFYLIEIPSIKHILFLYCRLSAANFNNMKCIAECWFNLIRCIVYKYWLLLGVKNYSPRWNSTIIYYSLRLVGPTRRCKGQGWILPRVQLFSTINSWNKRAVNICLYTSFIDL